MNTSPDILLAAITSPVQATVLLVEDDAGNRKMFGWLLREAGYRILEAGTGDEALQLALSGPEVVILDVNLPDISGFEVCRQLRKLPQTRHAAVLHLSAVYVGSSDRTEGLDSGADAYLIKPVEPRELVAHVRATLRARTAEQAYRRAAQEWRSTFDAIHDPVCLLDLQGNVRRCNQALSDWLGQGFSRLIGRPIDDLLRGLPHLNDDPAVAYLGQGATRKTTELLLGDSWYRVSADPQCDEQGTRVGSVLILTDITRRKQLEEQLRQSQRLEAIGRLAGGVAHDFNNLLTSIVGNASLLSSKIQRGEPEYDLVSTIEGAAWRGAELTRQLLGFARQTLLWLQVVDPGLILGEARERLQPSLTERIALEVEVAPDLWPIQADASQLAHVVFQLGLNALEALKGSGRILLQAVNHEVTPEHAAAYLEARAGSFVRLTVHDDGPAIEPELLGSIFDPFASAEPVGRASGLALAMVHGIIKQHQGWAECISSPQLGTSFHLYLPHANVELPRTRPTLATAAFPTGTHRILLVDDDPTLRSLAGTYLRQGGFEVLLADSGQPALELYQRDASRIDLVILDQKMPHLSGADLFAELRQINPSARVLFAVGSPAGPIAGLDVAGVITKPYRERELLQAVHAALQAP